jgi:hypothetical protein
VIYQGRIGGLLWYHPTEVERTGVTTADVPSSYLGALDAGVEETSVANARAYVHNLVQYRYTQKHPPSETTPTTARKAPAQKAPVKKVPTTTTTKGF